MTVLNFAHPFTADHLAQLERLTGSPVGRVVARECQLDLGRPLAEQVRALVDQVGLAPAAWQTEPIVLNVPSLGAIAVTLLAEIHGRSGHFPPIIRMSPEPGTVPTRYVVAEILNLDRVREEARLRRGHAPG